MRFMSTLALTVLVCAPLPTLQAETVRQYDFQESEPGIAPYVVRWQISPEWLRIDDLDESGGFILFDRQKRIIHSVNHQSRVIFQIADQTLESLPERKTAVAISQEALSQAPKVGGQTVQQIRYQAGPQLCRLLNVAPNWQPEAVQAMREYQQVLLAQQLQSREQMPAEYRTPCLESNTYYEALHGLHQGFPLQQEDYTGHRRALVNLQSVDVDSAWVKLPDGYKVVKAQ